MGGAHGLAAAVPRDEHALAERRILARIRDEQHRPAGRQHEVLRKLVVDVGVRIVRISLADDHEIRMACVARHDDVGARIRAHPVARHLGPCRFRVKQALERGMALIAPFLAFAEIVCGPGHHVERSQFRRIDCKQAGQVRVETPRQPQREFEARMRAPARVEVHDDALVAHHGRSIDGGSVSAIQSTKRRAGALDSDQRRPCGINAQWRGRRAGRRRAAWTPIPINGPA